MTQQAQPPAVRDLEAGELPELERRLSDPDWRVAQRSAEGVLGHRGPNAERALRGALGHADAAVRLTVARTLLVVMALRARPHEQACGRIEAWLASAFVVFRERGLQLLDEVERRRREGTGVGALAGALRPEFPSARHEAQWRAILAGEPLDHEVLAGLPAEEWLWTEYGLVHMLRDHQDVRLLHALEGMGSRVLSEVSSELLAQPPADGWEPLFRRVLERFARAGRRDA